MSPRALTSTADRWMDGYGYLPNSFRQHCPSEWTAEAENITSRFHRQEKRANSWVGGGSDEADYVRPSRWAKSCRRLSPDSVVDHEVFLFGDERSGPSQLSTRPIFTSGCGDSYPWVWCVRPRGFRLVSFRPGEVFFVHLRYEGGIAFTLLGTFGR